MTEKQACTYLIVLFTFLLLATFTNAYGAGLFVGSLEGLPFNLADLMATNEIRQKGDNFALALYNLGKTLQIGTTPCVIVLFVLGVVYRVRGYHA